MLQCYILMSVGGGGGGGGGGVLKLVYFASRIYKGESSGQWSTSS